MKKEKKKFGLKRLGKSFIYSMEGLKYAFCYEQNIVIHILATVFVSLIGIYFQLNQIEWLCILFAIGLVISAELLNTAIEATVDLTTTNIDPLAKLAKDTASAAVLVLALTSLLVGLIIFIPKIVLLF